MNLENLDALSQKIQSMLEALRTLKSEKLAAEKGTLTELDGNIHIWDGRQEHKKELKKMTVNQAITLMIRHTENVDTNSMIEIYEPRIYNRKNPFI